MSIQQITNSLGRLTLDSMPVIFSRPSRSLHIGSCWMKNFNSRLPKNIKIGRFRLESNVDPEKYTLKPLLTAGTGGRGLDGRIWVHKIGGGNRKRYRMIDTKRIGPPEGPPLVEKINAIRYDPFRTAQIAVAVSKNNKRYILASENMAVGDLVKTSGQLTSMPVRATEGDSHPIGSLPLGTLVYNIETIPGEGGLIARAAGTCGVFVRKIGDQCIVRMPSKRELIVSQMCMVTVGKVSNPDHHKLKKMRKAGQNRWRGKRPCSGWWQRKTGYHGRKIKPVKPPTVLQKKEKPEVFAYTVR